MRGGEHEIVFQMPVDTAPPLQIRRLAAVALAHAAMLIRDARFLRRPGGMVASCFSTNSASVSSGGFVLRRTVWIGPKSPLSGE